MIARNSNPRQKEMRVRQRRGATLNARRAAPSEASGRGAQRRVIPQPAYPARKPENRKFTFRPTSATIWVGLGLPGSSMPARQPATRLNPDRLIASGHNGIRSMNRRDGGQAADAFEISVDDYLRHGVRRHRDQGGARGRRDDRPNPTSRLAHVPMRLATYHWRISCTSAAFLEPFSSSRSSSF